MVAIEPPRQDRCRGCHEQHGAWWISVSSSPNITERRTRLEGKSRAREGTLSRQDDVILANPFGPAVRRWSDVAAALDFASSRFRDGTVAGFKRLASYVSDDLAALLELERWNAKVADRGKTDRFELPMPPLSVLPLCDRTCV